MSDDEPSWMSRVHNRLGLDWTCTVIQTRYGGSYEGEPAEDDPSINGPAEWVAFPCPFYEVPQEAVGNDVAAMGFWEGSATAAAVALVGRGSTADEAYADMVRRWEPHEADRRATQHRPKGER